MGISEATDSLTIIVSEETGRVSIAYGGSLMRSVDQDKLREELVKLQNKIVTDDRRSLIRGRSKV